MKFDKLYESVINESSPELKKYGIKSLSTGLTLDMIKSDYPWILKAKIKDAELGIDSDNGRKYLCWWRGIWLDGEWKSGSWRNGHWMKGDWLNGEWIDGRWHDGTWHDGVWGGGQWDKGKWIKGDVMGDFDREYTD